MGLAGPSKKRKISHDPNNTTWSRSTGFGHRMLTAQGWTQGTILGPDPNNPHHTAASQVGIKVMLKDDTLGIGCKGSQEDTCTGLGDLQSLLGRLNGRSDESVKQEEDTRKKMWMEGRYGMRFVRGEVLESTWVISGLKKEDDTERVDSDAEGSDTSETSGDNTTSSDDRGKAEKTDDKKKRKRKASGEGNEEKQLDKEKRKAEKALRKAARLAKRERKEAKRQRKEERRKNKAEKKAPTPTVTTSHSATENGLKSGGAETPKPWPNSLPASGSSTPVTGRQALRSKWIAQKKMAVMDAKALNEVCIDSQS
ncbi:hypothetical protein DRE_06627 [Drechslerella stenobrocha 248]|uniref:G-patch domain-containing protein n=1 Tax=Drechslerella stenobrocha 248 TaxID=1043628 RepID=W7HXJ2_9PEZI|nr:hypothetical protein DRE_06627 [Drechslerella stenobrocha 248]